MLRLAGLPNPPEPKDGVDPEAAMLPNVGALAADPNVGAFAADPPNCPKAELAVAGEDMMGLPFPKAGGEPNG